MDKEVKKVSASELERQIFELDEVKVVIRAPREQMFQEYKYQKKADKAASVSEWAESRIKPIMEGTEYEIVKGDGSSPHGRTKMETVRSSYKV